MNEVFDWKGKLEELKNQIIAENERHRNALSVINDKAHEVIVLAGKDAEQTWNNILADFKEIGKKIHWYQNKWIYIAVFLVLFFMAMHYIFGI